jgi:hypothetical protein
MPTTFFGPIHSNAEWQFFWADHFRIFHLTSRDAEYGRMRHFALMPGMTKIFATSILTYIRACKIPSTLFLAKVKDSYLFGYKDNSLSNY